MNTLHYIVCAYLIITAFIAGRYWESDFSWEGDWKNKSLEIFAAVIILFSIVIWGFIYIKEFVIYLYNKTWLRSYFALLKYEKDMSTMSSIPGKLKYSLTQIQESNKSPEWLKKRFTALVEKKLQLLREERIKNNEVVDF